MIYRKDIVIIANMAIWETVEFFLRIFHKIPAVNARKITIT